MNYSDIGATVTREQFCDFLNSVQGGQYFHVKGYINAEGEKSDHILRFGIKYGALKVRDVNTLNAVQTGKKTFSVHVTHGVWIPEGSLTLTSLVPQGQALHAVNGKLTFDKVVDGVTVKAEFKGSFDLSDETTFSSRKAKGKVPCVLSYDVESSHPLAIQAVASAMTSLVAPRPAAVEYDKEAKSCYSLDTAEGIHRWYLRDVLAVSKIVRVKGDYAFSASAPHVAIKGAIQKELLLTAKYRQFILTDGQFDSITIEGQAVLVDGITEDFFMALPEHLQAATVEAEAV